MSKEFTNFYQKMKLLIAPDSFKENLTSVEIAEIIAKQARKHIGNKSVAVCPLSDGGDGFAEVLKFHLRLKEVPVTAVDSLKREISTTILFDSGRKTAFIESANAIGLHLLTGKEKNPVQTTSYGLGMIILKAFELGAKKIIIGLGGSATNDAGCGMLQALGAKFLDKKGDSLEMNGQNLLKIEEINLEKLDHRIKTTEFMVACDVENVLFGPEGAAYVYAPQKGANKEQVHVLDKGLRNFNEKAIRTIRENLANIIGGGAAGGLGACFAGFLSSQLDSGFAIVSEFAKLEQRIKASDLVITGEGKLDNQSLNGKLIGEMLKLCNKYSTKVIVIAGEVDEKAEILNRNDLISAFSIQNKPMSLEDSLENSRKLIAFTAQNILKCI